MEMTQKRWIAIILALIVDAVLIALSVLSMGPSWVVEHAELLVPNLNLLMSPLIVLAIVLGPTMIFLKWAWPDDLDVRQLLFPLRLALAYEFLHGGLEKVMDTTYLDSPGLIGFGASSAPSPWIQSVMNMMLGNYEFFLLLIAWGEVLIGLSMFFGGFTRLGAIGGAVMQWTFVFLLFWLGPAVFGVNFVGALAFLIVGLYQTGRWIGVDQFLGPKFDESENPILKFLGWLT